MDSVDMLDTEIENHELDKSVADKSKEITDEQLGEDTDEFEIEVEGEEEQQDTSNEGSKNWEHQALKKERAKRKQASKERDELQKRLDAIEKQMAETATSVAEVKRGKRPSPYDFDSEEEFYEALDKWNKAGHVEIPKQKQNKPAFEIPTEILDEVEESENKIAESGISDYSYLKESVNESLDEAFPNAQKGVIGAQLQTLSVELGIDPAKVMVALSKNPRYIGKIQQSAESRIKLRNVLRELESKVKLRAKKKIDTKPEPSINSNGPIDNSSAAIEKLRKQWQENPTTANYQKYQAAKKRKGNE